MTGIRAKFSPAGLPQTIALFPLDGALLLPGGRLPLKLFEPRYLSMFADCMAQGRQFGMVQTATGDTVARVGCLGRVVNFAEADDGSLHIALAGVSRFAVVRDVGDDRPYRRARVDYAAYAADDADENLPLPKLRAAVLAALRDYFDARGFAADWDVIEAMTDTQVITTLSMACPFDPLEKQALLEAADTPARAEMLLALLQMGAASNDDGSKNLN